MIKSRVKIITSEHSGILNCELNKTVSYMESQGWELATCDVRFLTEKVPFSATLHFIKEVSA